MGRRMIRLRYPTKCAVCFRALERGTSAEWNDVRKVAICKTCIKQRPRDAASSGPGVSARTEGRRRHDAQAQRHQRVKKAHPILGRLSLTMYPERDKGASWAKGGAAEQVLGQGLNRLATHGLTIPLHDRQMPGTRANIDHLVVAPSGVWVVDAKSYTGLIARKDRGGFFLADQRLVVNGRDRSSLIEGVGKQALAVRDVVGAFESDVAVHQALCFVDGDWGWRRRPFTIDGVVITWPKALRKMLHAEGPLDSAARCALAERLDQLFPPAAWGNELE